MSREPTLSDVILTAVRTQLLDLHVMLPGKIQSYDSANQKVDVVLTVLDQQLDNSGNVAVSEFPVLSGIPVMFQRCAGGWFTWPLAVGDQGMVLVSDVSLSQWAAAASGNVTDPKDMVLHNFGGAVFVPGLYPPSDPIPSPSTSHPVIHTETELHLGEKGLSNDQFVAIADLVSDALGTLKSAIANAAVSPGDGGATLKTNIGLALVGWPPNLAATKVKAK